MGCFIRQSLRRKPITPRHAFVASEPSSSHSNVRPSVAVDSTLSSQALIADATKRSPHAHLFHFYTLLYEIATVPRTTPSAWVVPLSTTSFGQPMTPPESLNGRNGVASTPSSTTPPNAVEVDARQLAKACLREIGKEIGAEI